RKSSREIHGRCLFYAAVDGAHWDGRRAAPKAFGGHRSAMSLPSELALYYHAVAVDGGIGGGVPADMRFRQATRCRMRKISQPTNATRPAGMVTSMNQPITPSE